MVDIEVVRGDIFDADADLLIFKFAGAFYGADGAAAAILGGEQPRYLHPGESQMIRHHAQGIRAPAVLFFGVGELHKFRYQEILSFGKELVPIVYKELPSAQIVATTVHGVGYGLDEKEAVWAFLAGIDDAAKLQQDRNIRTNLQTVRIVERDVRRAGRVENYLYEFRGLRSASIKQPKPSDLRRDSDKRRSPNNKPRDRGLDVGLASEKKPHIFVAMPFDNEYLDEWEIGIREPVSALNFLCERMDADVFTGDILARIKDRIDTCALLVGVLTGDNPNVYLEIGYAWGKGKPTILAVRTGQSVRFDVRGQKYLEYQNINDLRNKMRRELSGLVANNVMQITK